MVVQAPAAARAAAGLPGIDVALEATPTRQARMFFDALHGRSGDLSEVRWRRERGMGQEWFLDRATAARRAVELGVSTDVYAGVVPRRFRKGGRDALVPTCSWLWAECDTAASVERALRISPQAQMVIRSSPGRAHFYWALREPLELAHLERALKRLAWDIGSDMKATDAARILRVPGTTNHKCGEPCVWVGFNPGVPNVDIRKLVSHLPDPSPPRSLSVQKPDRPASAASNVPARVYVERLSGREVRHNMVQCPFHGGGSERTPSLHVGGPNENLWHCFGCGEGSDVFGFAARLWGMDEKREFAALKKRVEAEL